MLLTIRVFEKFWFSSGNLSSLTWASGSLSLLANQTTWWLTSRTSVNTAIYETNVKYEVVTLLSIWYCYLSKRHTKYVGELPTYFSKGGTVGFFQGRARSGEIWFFRLILRKQPFLLKISRSKEDKLLLPPLRTIMGVKTIKNSFRNTFSFFWCKYLNIDSCNQLFTSEKRLKNYKHQPIFFKSILCKKSLDCSEKSLGMVPVLCPIITCGKTPTTITWSASLKIRCHVIVMQQKPN